MANNAKRVYKRIKLNEVSRRDLINRSKNVEATKLYGTTRYERRMKCKVIDTVASFNKVDMNALFKGNMLSFIVPVQGETNKYNVELLFEGILDEIQKAELAREKLKDEPNNEIAKEESKLDNWLEPVFNTKKKRGFLNMSFKEYLVLLDWTGRQIRDDKRGAISEELESILKRVGLKSEKWIDTFLCFEKDFKRVAGSENTIQKQAKKANNHWFQGVGCAKQHFIQ